MLKKIGTVVKCTAVLVAGCLATVVGYVFINSLLLPACAMVQPKASDPRLKEVYDKLQEAGAKPSEPQAATDTPKPTQDAAPGSQTLAKQTPQAPYERHPFGALIPPPERVNPPGTIPCYLHRSPLGNHPDVVKVRNDTQYPLELRDNANGVAVAGAPYGWLPPSEACYYVLPQHGKHNLRAVMWRLNLYAGRPTQIAVLKEEEYFSPTSSRLHFVVWTGTEERVR